MSKEDRLILQQAIDAFVTATPDGRKRGLQLLRELAVQEETSREMVQHLDEIRDAVGAVKSLYQQDRLTMSHLDSLARIVERARQQVVYPIPVEGDNQPTISGTVDGETFAEEIAKLDDRVREIEDRLSLHKCPVGKHVRIIGTNSKFYGQHGRVIADRGYRGQVERRVVRFELGNVTSLDQEFPVAHLGEMTP